MNKIIKDQLAKTRVNLPAYDDSTTDMLIRKSSGTIQIDDGPVVGKCYVLYLEDYLINEPENFTLSSNWNNGTKPTENKVNAKVMQAMGKMIQIYTQALQSGTIWTGWVPKKAVKILEELNV